jgi:hypothetical protein
MRFVLCKVTVRNLHFVLLDMYGESDWICGCEVDMCE